MVGDEIEAGAGKRRMKVAAKKTAKPKGTSGDGLVDAGVGSEETHDESPPVSRKELLEKALRIVAEDLQLTGGKRPTNTIGNLVQLLKLDRSFKEDEEQPHEIRVVWEEKRDETIDYSAGNSNERSHET